VDGDRPAIFHDGQSAPHSIIVIPLHPDERTLAGQDRQTLDVRQVLELGHSRVKDSGIPVLDAVDSDLADVDLAVEFHGVILERAS
jgi:hypothetical protein